ncbi:hypothetical protein BJX96DRAFT_152479 [Aspergillus floccosus]
MRKKRRTDTRMMRVSERVQTGQRRRPEREAREAKETIVGRRSADRWSICVFPFWCNFCLRFHSVREGQHVMAIYSSTS